MSNAIWIGIGLFLLLEGLAPMLIPATWKRYLQQISVVPENTLRRAGGVMVVIGGVLLYYNLGT